MFVKGVCFVVLCRNGEDGGKKKEWMSLNGGFGITATEEVFEGWRKRGGCDWCFSELDGGGGAVRNYLLQGGRRHVYIL